MSANIRPAAATGSGGTAEKEEILLLDDKLYDELKAAAVTARSRAGIAELFGPEKEKIDAFLYWEARLLDGKRYRDWVNLLTADFIYWVPGNLEAVDPRAQGAVNFDDRRRVIDRITLTETNLQWSQIPRSRTCRMISNIEAFRGPAGTVQVRSNLAIWEHRRGRTQSFFGWQEHELVAGADHYRIRRKLIHLIDCDEPQGNTTFIL